MRVACLLFLAAAASTDAFAPTATRLPLASRSAVSTRGGVSTIVAQQKRDGGESLGDYTERLNLANTAFSLGSMARRAAVPAMPAGLALSQFVLPIQEAAAKGGEYGLVEGKAFALIHPLMMAGLYALTLFTGYQGLQWRTLRSVGDDMKPLQEKKNQLVAKKEAAEAAEQAVPADVAASLKEVEAELSQLSSKRKDLMSGNYRDKHWAGASILLATGVLFSIEGAFDTYFRVGKLFPGPHLFAGAGITVGWAMAASLVPAMQKGDANARSAHIALNTIILGLFTWQLPTGFTILQNVWNKVAWIPAVAPPA